MHRFVPTTFARSLALLGIAGCLSTPIDASAHVKPVALPGGDFIFTDNGNNFRFIGANEPGLPWVSEDLMKQELDKLKAMGTKVVRVWGSDSGHTAGQMVDRLRPVLDAAQARGMYVLISLSTTYDDTNYVLGQGTTYTVPGDEVFRTRTYTDGVSGTHKLLNDEWIKWGYQVNYKGYASWILLQLRDHPAIFGWDILNELSPEQASNAGSLVDFYLDMASFIKQQDPNHMVGTGLISTTQAKLGNDQANRLYASPNIDFVTVHEYRTATEGPQLPPTLDNCNRRPANPAPPSDYDCDIRRAADTWHKPAIVEEFGAYNGTKNPGYIAFRYYAKRFRASEPKDRVAGLAYWGVSSFPWWADNHWYNNASVESPYYNPAYWYPVFSAAWNARINQLPQYTDRLAATDVLGSASAKVSQNLLHVLLMSDGGALEIWDRDSTTSPFRKRWSSGTEGQGPADLLVEKTALKILSGNATIWTKPCSRKYSASDDGSITQFVMQNDGNVVAYGEGGKVRCHYYEWIAQ